MISVNHVLSSHILNSQIFDDFYLRALALTPSDFTLSQTINPDKNAIIRHYHRPHRERRLLTPAVVTMHHDPNDSDQYLPIKTFLSRWREADRVICLNNSQKEFLTTNNINNAVVIPHGVDREIFPVPRFPRITPREKCVLGFVSRRYSNGVKGEEGLTKLLHTLDPKLFSFIFLGEGRWIDAMAAAKSGFEVVHYERLPYHLMGELFAKMSALLILSKYEGGPASLPEAIGSGLPVLARKVGMTTDWIKDGINGVILSDEEWIDQIIDLSKNKDLLMRLNLGAFKSAQNFPSWKHIYASHFELYRSVLNDVT